jgi:hypothetical protein
VETLDFHVRFKQNEYRCWAYFLPAIKTGGMCVSAKTFNIQNLCNGCVSAKTFNIQNFVQWVCVCKGIQHSKLVKWVRPQRRSAFKTCAMG